MLNIVRIIAGKNRGFILKTKRGETTRPTLDRIRENLFNIIRDRLPEAAVLDLFAGSGAIGLEALSRGAREAVMIEKDAEAYAILKENIRNTNNLENGQAVRGDCFSYLQNCHRNFDLIYGDPPYGLKAYLRILEATAASEALKPGGLLILESPRDEDLPQVTNAYICSRKAVYGNTAIHFYQRK